jgi:hypothetical protein
MILIGRGLHLLLLPAAMDFLNYINKSLRKEKGKENASVLFESVTAACPGNSTFQFGLACGTL